MTPLHFPLNFQLHQCIYSVAKKSTPKPRILRLGFVLTDGQTRDKNLLREEISHLRKANVTLYGIGVGEKCTADTPDDNLDFCLNVTELDLIASNENHTFYVSQYGQLTDIVEVPAFAGWMDGGRDGGTEGYRDGGIE